jgi:hypothetical protein
MSEFTQDDLAAFVRGYKECAMWSSTDDNGEPLDAGRGFDDIAPESAAVMADECADFLSLLAREGILPEALNAYNRRTRAECLEWAGHDFWLTRNGHGAGFWDRGLGELGETLSTLARVAGSRDLYIGDDGRIYQA